MNKKELVTKISDALNQSKVDAERMFDTTMQIILDCLKNDEAVKIAGFGTYKVAKRKARIGRNPRTGESVFVPEKKAPIFKSGKGLRDRLNYKA